MNCRKFDSRLGFAVAFAIAAALIIFGVLGARESHGATVCRSRSVQRLTYAPLAQQVAYQPLYQVAPWLQKQAVDTHQFRQSDEWVELQQLRGYKAGVESVTQHAEPEPAPVAEGTPPAAAVPTPEPLPDAPEPTPASPYPTIIKHCSKCHTGTEPKGDVWLDGTVPLDGPDKAATRDAIIRQTFTGHMPKGKPLDDATFSAILGELYAEPSK